MAQKFVSGTFTDNGDSSQVEVTARAIAFIGSSGGTNFGSGTVTVQLMSPTGDWCSNQQTATASDVLSIDVGIPTVVRLSLTGSTSPDIDYAIQSDQTNLTD